MNRRGTAADIRRILKKARDMGFTLRTSLIVGFPGETEEQFQELMDFVAEARFDRMGAFAFSPEENTPAAEMPDQIPEEVKQERLDRLMKLQARISLENNQARIGTVEKVLGHRRPGRAVPGPLPAGGSRRGRRHRLYRQGSPGGGQLCAGAHHRRGNL